MCHSCYEGHCWKFYVTRVKQTSLALCIYNMSDIERHIFFINVIVFCNYPNILISSYCNFCTYLTSPYQYNTLHKSSVICQCLCVTHVMKDIWHGLTWVTFFFPFHSQNQNKLEVNKIQNCMNVVWSSISGKYNAFERYIQVIFESPKLNNTNVLSWPRF